MFDKILPISLSADTCWHIPPTKLIKMIYWSNVSLINGQIRLHPSSSSCFDNHFLYLPIGHLKSAGHLVLIIAGLQAFVPIQAIGALHLDLAFTLADDVIATICGGL